MTSRSREGSPASRKSSFNASVSNSAHALGKQVSSKPWGGMLVEYRVWVWNGSNPTVSEPSSFGALSESAPDGASHIVWFVPRGGGQFDDTRQSPASSSTSAFGPRSAERSFF